MKTLILVRGLPGSGKSTIAQTMASLSDDVFEVAADDFFDEFHNGEFVPPLIKEAHQWCRGVVSGWMDNSLDNRVIIVHNTFTQDWEMEPYFELATHYGFVVHTIVAENRHGSKSVHGVPEETMKKMKDRFEIKLGDV